MRIFRLTRLAPTPSGYLHTGNVLSFILTAGLAHRFGAGILLRIDDLDRSRYRENYLEDIFETLRFLEIPWTVGPTDCADFHRNYSQHQRLGLYEDILARLRAADMVFACRCSRKQISESGEFDGYPGTCISLALPLVAPDTAWRIRPLATHNFHLKDPFGGGKALPLPTDLQMSVVRKKDGFCGYHLASLADDSYFGVDLIVRGADLYGSTLFQQALARCIGEQSFSQVAFVHHPLVYAADGRKLSKSAGAASIMQLRKSGYSRQEILSEMARIAGIDRPVDRWESLFSELVLRWVPQQ